MNKCGPFLLNIIMCMEKITILLIDDHRLLREAWSDMLNADDRFHVMGDTLLFDVGFKTIEANRCNILRKLNLKNSASLVNFFNANGI